MKGEEFSRLGGATAIDFVNTRPLRKGVECERIKSFADLVSWARAFGILESGQACLLTRNDATAEAAYRQALNLRDLLRRAFETIAEGGKVPDELVLALNCALRQRTGSLQIERDEERLNLSFVSSPERPVELVGAIAQSIGELLVRVDLTRLKRCGGPKCVLWFLDTTRNKSRHWCRMERCGARAKASAYYRRQKESNRLPKTHV